jgi:hypothetical protein
MVAVSGRDVLKAYGLLKEMAALSSRLVIYLHRCIMRYPGCTLPQIQNCLFNCSPCEDTFPTSAPISDDFTFPDAGDEEARPLSVPRLRIEHFTKHSTSEDVMSCIRSARTYQKVNQKTG